MRTENAKDLQLLNLMGLAPLGAGTVAGDGGLVTMVESHNERLARAAERLRQLAADRERLADFDAWQEADSADIATARCHVRRESWDAILGLRRVLVERDAILGEMEQYLRERYQALGDEHNGAVVAAETRLAGERRVIEKANPYNAGPRFAEVVAAEEPVAAAAEKMDSAREALESIAAARRAVGSDLRTVAARQREVLAWLVA